VERSFLAIARLSYIFIWLLYESALTDHENVFLDITKTHKKVYATKRYGGNFSSSVGHMGIIPIYGSPKGTVVHLWSVVCRRLSSL